MNDTLRRSTGGKSVSCVEMRGNRSNGQLGRVGYRLRMWQWWRLANGRGGATAPDESYLDPWLFPTFSHPTTNRRLLLRRWTTWSKLVKRPAKQGHLLSDRWCFDCSSSWICSQSNKGEKTYICTMKKISSSIPSSTIFNPIWVGSKWSARDGQNGC